MRLLIGKQVHPAIREHVPHSQVPGWELYGDQMARVLQEIAPSKDAFFKVMGGNALECFGLSASGGDKALSRLKQYYASNGLPGGPGWSFMDRRFTNVHAG